VSAAPIGAPESKPTAGAGPARAYPLGIDIRLVDRDDAATIDPDAWDLLADNARIPNPFYERWNLLSAVKHLDKSEKVFIVTGYQSGRLVCLFPVCLKRKAVFFPYLMLWQFRDCLMSDVLYDGSVPLTSVFRALMDRLKVQMIVSPTHRKEGFEIAAGCSFCQIRRSRKAVVESTSWEEYQSKLPRKYRKENRRIITRLLEKVGAQYITAEDDLVDRWLPLYMDTENISWKARHGHVTSSDINRRNYLEEAISRGEKTKKIEFQALVKDDEVLAVSFRFKAQNNAYEIKTTYNETYKQYHPGVVLELLNIKSVLEKGFTLVDSCAFKNKVVDRLWPDDVVLYRTVVFKKTIAGKLAQLVYKGYRQILLRLNNDRFFCAERAARSR
jgi:hypothetical protein